MNGLRRNSRSAMFTPFCTWLISLVMRVMSVLVPAVSISEKPSVWIWANSICRSPAAQPTAARAAKYWAVTLQARPISASSTSSPHRRRI